jgi:hypothetical protein
MAGSDPGKNRRAGSTRSNLAVTLVLRSYGSPTRSPMKNVDDATQEPGATKADHLIH